MRALGKIKKEQHHTAEVYHFTFDGGCCWWATFTIVEDLGEFTIVSDCGNYNHRWPAMGLDGEPLKDFLTRCDAGYVLDKFSYSNKTDLEPEVDYAATRKEFRKTIGEWYRDCRGQRVLPRGQYAYRKIDKYHVQELLDEIDDLLDDEPPTNLIMERMSGKLWKALGDEPWGLICHRASPRYEVLHDHLLPFFFNWLREQGHGSV